MFNITKNFRNYTAVEGTGYEYTGKTLAELWWKIKHSEHLVPLITVQNLENGKKELLSDLLQDKKLLEEFEYVEE